MAGILSYLRWRGDISFKQKPFNSIDAALLATISYLPFKEQDKGKTLEAAAKRIIKDPASNSNLNTEAGLQLQLLAQSPRLGHCELLDWTERKRSQPALQFAAMTVRLSKHKILLAYRGTDRSMIGLNEDMTMSYTDEIYGQEIAADYLRLMAHDFPLDQIYLTGHSKGGNYACYSAGAVSGTIQARIVQAYSFDGPGFTKTVYTAQPFQRALPKMKTYLPEGSFFGAMLDHPERTIIVKSTYPMPHQHNPWHWSVGRDRFVLAKGLTTSSHVIRTSLISFNKNIPSKDRDELWSALFAAFEDMNITQAGQLTDNKVVGAFTLTKAYIALSPRLRTIARQIVADLYQAVRQQAKRNYPISNDSAKAPIFDDSYAD
ncbi:MAG: DUF2974 domain-containing protein [Lactobacillus sp.]|jgi:hypothetical protein|nr:DUF2974 domain-containing protein [Lactobacillus sp.]